VSEYIDLKRLKKTEFMNFGCIFRKLLDEKRIKLKNDPKNCMILCRKENLKSKTIYSSHASASSFTDVNKIILLFRCKSCDRWTWSTNTAARLYPIEF